MSGTNMGEAISTLTHSVRPEGKVFQFSHESKFDTTCGMNVNSPFETFNAAACLLVRAGRKVWGQSIFHFLRKDCPFPERERFAM